MKNKKIKVVIVSGGFDPIHSGHLRMIRDCKLKLKADMIFVILNSDKFLLEKKGYKFMDFEERKEMLENVRFVDQVIPCIDKDQTVCKTLKKIGKNLQKSGTYDVYFANGGDRTKDNIPEVPICEAVGITMIFGVGGKKIQSSSELVKKVKTKL